MKLNKIQIFKLCFLIINLNLIQWLYICQATIIMLIDYIYRQSFSFFDSQCFAVSRTQPVEGEESKQT